MGEPDLQLERFDHDQGRAELRLTGRCEVSLAPRLWDQARALLAPPARAVLLNLEGVTALDGACAALVLQLRGRLAEQGVPAEIIGARGDVRAILDLYDDRRARASTRPPPRRVGTVEQVGDFTATLASQARSILDFVGQVAAGAAGALRRPRSIHWADLGRLMERTGADAAPIVGLIAFLIGLVTAFQSVDTFKQYGANIFVADMVGLSITRLMGPLMMAILVTGRSGAGFAAELGTMKVSEEIDALRTLGLDPIRFLVIPRVLALVLMVPLLTLMADVIGIGGGLLIAITQLDLTVPTFMGRLDKAIDLWDIGTGLILSLAYGVAIGMIACERGLATRGGAEGVGRSTTSAVVTILFHLVVITSVLTILFQVWGV